MTRQTSIHSVKTYHEIDEMKHSLQNKIFKLLFHYQKGLNIRQVALRLKIDKSCASGRLNELRKYEAIKYRGKEYRVIALHAGKDSTTLKTVTFWGVKPLDREPQQTKMEFLLDQN